MIFDARVMYEERIIQLSYKIMSYNYKRIIKIKLETCILRI